TPVAPAPIVGYLDRELHRVTLTRSFIIHALEQGLLSPVKRCGGKRENSTSGSSGRNIKG
ncbi:MAG TPA: hypothetical protein PLV56_05620, partial [Synergistales bacterium]|nr:hypothetical protein [Synergistales bacterium]